MTDESTEALADQLDPQPEAEEKPKQTRRPRAPKAPETPVLALGRTVIYTTPSETHRPAVVTKLHEDGRVDLTVFNSEGAVAATNVREGEDFEAHTYHWPVR